MALSFIKWMGSWWCGGDESQMPADMLRRQEALEARISRQSAASDKERRRMSAAAVAPKIPSLDGKDGEDAAGVQDDSDGDDDHDKEMKTMKPLSNVLSPEAARQRQLGSAAAAAATAQEDTGVLQDEDAAAQQQQKVNLRNQKNSETLHRVVLGGSSATAAVADPDDPLADVDDTWVSRPRTYNWLEDRKQQLARAKLPAEEQIRLQQEEHAQRQAQILASGGGKIKVPPIALLGAAQNTALMAPLNKMRQQQNKRDLCGRKESKDQPAGIVEAVGRGVPVVFTDEEKKHNYSNASRARLPVSSDMHRLRATNQNNSNNNNHNTSSTSSAAGIFSEDNNNNNNNSSSFSSTSRPSAQAAGPVDVQEVANAKYAVQQKQQAQQSSVASKNQPKQRANNHDDDEASFGFTDDEDAENESLHFSEDEQD